ncbi:MAG: PadR family transcriptional regulator [Vallitaleaceae bacterium]|nr:PadR family transcriptional regulator [Vallitaleaceae bacterium]
MDKVILGFLLIRSLTQYDLLQALQKKVSPFYKASLGSIQHALKALLEKGYITSERIENDPRKKSLYQVTAQGKQYFENWMFEAIDENKLEAQLSIKLFFMGHLTQANRLTVIDQIILCLEKLVNDYQVEKKHYDTLSWNEPLKDIVHYQLKTLDLGYSHHLSALNWFKELRLQGESK